MTKFADQVVLITGAGRGVGRDLAEAFANEGAIIAANDITPINLDETVVRIRQADGHVKDYVTDITKKMPIQAMLNQIIDDWERIDILINNAHVDPKRTILDLDEWDWRRAVDVNLTGPFLTTQSVGRIMKEAGGGIILNILSGDEGHAIMKASQLGLIGLTQEAGAEFSAYNIRVSAIAKTPIGIPLPKLAPTMDIIQAAFYLCLQPPEKINGKTFSLNS
jgi:3-oxoacyl-[acyl-carrier protein] reductase